MRKENGDWEVVDDELTKGQRIVAIALAALILICLVAGCVIVTH